MKYRLIIYLMFVFSIACIFWAIYELSAAKFWQGKWYQEYQTKVSIVEGIKK